MTKITRRTRTTTLDRLALACAATLRAEAPRARERILDADEIGEALRAHRAGLRAAAPDDVACRTVARGGYVPNSYGYRAEADEVAIETTIATGETTITASRARAKSWGAGNGPLCVVRLRRDGQRAGRVVS